MSDICEVLRRNDSGDHLSNLLEYSRTAVSPRARMSAITPSTVLRTSDEFCSLVSAVVIAFLIYSIAMFCLFSSLPFVSAILLSAISERGFSHVTNLLPSRIDWLCRQINERSSCSRLFFTITTLQSGSILDSKGQARTFEFGPSRASYSPDFVLPFPPGISRHYD